MKVAFYWLNGGLVLMIATSLMPIGIQRQPGACGTSQRSLHAGPAADPAVRTFSDIVFIIGALAMAGRQQAFLPRGQTRAAERGRRCPNGRLINHMC